MGSFLGSFCKEGIELNKEYFCEGFEIDVFFDSFITLFCSCISVRFLISRGLFSLEFCRDFIFRGLHFELVTLVFPDFLNFAQISKFPEDLIALRVYSTLSGNVLGK
jgi:hypothetical protein